MSDPDRRALRRWMPVVLVVAFTFWIIFLYVMIAINPAASSGNPLR